MSDSPCTGCRSTRNGRLFFAYVNHYGGDDLEKRRVRLCQQCVADLLAPLLECADFMEDGQWLSFDTKLAPPASSESTVRALHATPSSIGGRATRTRPKPTAGQAST